MRIEFSEFSCKWGSPDHPSEAESLDSLTALEEKLGVSLPSVYVEFMKCVGSIWLPDILSSVVEFESPLHSLQQFASAKEVLEQTFGWREAGMPSHLIAFAGDAMGNKFCFDHSSCVQPRPYDIPVLFWDHDEDEVSVASASFLDLLGAYVALPKSVG